MADYNTLEEVIFSTKNVLHFYFNIKKEGWVPMTISTSPKGDVLQLRNVMPEWIKLHINDTDQNRELLASQLIISKISFETIIRDIKTIESVEWCKSIYIGGHSDSPFWIRKGDLGKSLRDKGTKLYDSDPEEFFKQTGIYPGDVVDNQRAGRGYCLWIFSLVYPDEATLRQCLPSADQILQRK